MPLLIRTFLFIINDMKDFNQLKINRIFASLIDGLIMFIIFALINVAPIINVTKNAMSGVFVAADAAWLGFTIFASFAVWLIYLFVSALILKNATVGMKINNLVFVRNNGLNMTGVSILLREAAVVLSIILSLGLSIVFDPVSLICNDEGKNFYDILTSTKVVMRDDI